MFLLFPCSWGCFTNNLIFLKACVKEFALKAGFFVLKNKTSLFYLLLEHKFAGISVTYHHVLGHTFKAKLEVGDDVTCSPMSCQNREISGLQECATKTVSISHSSCTEPNKNLTLYVPPGKYTLMATCILTHTVPCRAGCLSRRPGVPR